MAQFARTIQNLRLMMERQPGNRFGAEYRPAQEATVSEAPSLSTATILEGEPKVGERPIHLLSRPELAAALLALFWPFLFDLHEQHMLSPGPTVNPLFGHPMAAGLSLNALAGTLEVADQMGRMAMHPTLLNKPKPDQATWHYVPWPYRGDLLLFLMDADGPYCVNWSVKDTMDAFTIPGGEPRKPRKKGVQDPRALERHELEDIHFASGGIRTVKVAEEKLHAGVTANLRSIFGDHVKKLDIGTDRQSIMSEIFRQAVGTDEVANSVALRAAAAAGVDRRTAQTVLNKAIWNREVRVDLFEPVLMNHPLIPERVDVCKHYAELFAR